MNPAQSLFELATRVAEVPLKVVGAVGRLGSDVEQLGREVARGALTTLSSEAERALFALLDAVVTRIMSEEVIDRVFERAEAAGVAQRVADRILEDGIAEQVAERAFSGPELERMLAAAFKSALPEELIGQLLASEAVWILVDEIARSPSVTEAIAHQGTGFLDQMAAKARDRSRSADVRVQRLAERLSRRGRRGDTKPQDDEVALKAPLPSEGAH
jgi:hypothetical protein